MIDAAIDEVDRRSALRQLAGVATIGATAVAAACSPPPAKTAPAPAAGGPPPGPPRTPSPAWHAAKRLTYGPTPALMAQINSMGSLAWIDSQLTTGVSAAETDLAATIRAAYPRSDAGAAAILDVLGDEWRTPYELSTATALRAIHSPRQLYEMVVAFFWDVITVDVNLEPTRWHTPTYDRDVIRANAFGRFDDMLVSSARSGAMLTFLDQATSRGDGTRVPNENYARELMELHTVGVDAGYTEDDVKAVASLLTGWTLTDMNRGTFVFKDAWHNPKLMPPTRTVLGFSRGSLTGQAAGEAFLRHLAHHPATANRLALRLATRFIGNHVTRTDPVVAATASTYLSSGTAILPTLSTLLSSSAFAASADRRVRRPIELYAAAVRAVVNTPMSLTKPDDLIWNLNSLVGGLDGMPHWWPAPNGYPDADAKWISVGPLIARWNLATQVGYNGVPGHAMDWTTINAWTSKATIGDWFDAAAGRLGITVDAASRTTMLSECGRKPTDTIKVANDRWVFPKILTFLLQAPEFQTR